MLNKNDIIIDVSGWQSSDLRGLLDSAGTNKTFIKATEGQSYVNQSSYNQYNTSDCYGFYHFARFGGNVGLAEVEAQHFINTAKSIGNATFAILDYEDDASGSVQANTSACLRFMDLTAQAGYKPLIYSYRPYFDTYLDINTIVQHYPESVWVAGYATMGPCYEADFNWLPHVTNPVIWQFTSNYKGMNIDASIVLQDLNSNNTLMEESMNFTFHIVNDGAWEPNTIYYYNSNTNEIRAVHNTEELKYIRFTYHDIFGKDLAHYDWNTDAPVYARVFGTLRPKRID